MVVEDSFAAIERWESKVHALVDWDPGRARRRAAAAAGKGPLAGWSIGVKDIIDLASETTACNAAFIPFAPATENAPVVDRFLGAGAYVAAKTVTTVFAYFDTGPTRNPWNLAHTPGGSSSGSAAAVACRMVRLALGTQTAGSIARPASFCGVVGFKPTYGLLPVAGVFPFAPSLDTVGYFTSSAADAQTAFAATTAVPIATAPAALRVGVVENLAYATAEAEMQRAVHAASEQLRRGGHDVRPLALPSFLGEAHQHHLALLGAEGARAHRELFDSYGDRYPAKLRQLIEAGRAITDARLDVARAHRERCQAAFDALFRSWDLVLTPSAPGTAPAGIESSGDPRMNMLWTYAGPPTVTLPVGLGANGLPLGVQLTAARGQDAALLAASVAAERAFSFHATPQLG